MARLFTAAAVLVLAVAACGPTRLASNPSPEPTETMVVVSPSAAASPSSGETPGTSPSSTPTSKPTPKASPSAAASAPPPPPALAIAGLPVHNGEVGLGYGSVSFSASGGVPPYTWSGAGGTLPSGLSLSSGGQLSGTPSAAGAFSFTVKVSDSGGHSTTGSAKVTIYSALKVTSTCATRCYIGTGCKKCWSFGAASGGLTPYAYKAISGAPPSAYGGLSLTAAPTKPGTYTLTVQVTDAFGVAQQVKANWTIYSPATLASGGNCINLANPPSCSVRWTYSGGSPTTAPKLVVVGFGTYCNGVQCGTPSALPGGWSASVSGGVITISAGGAAAFPCNGPIYIGAVNLALQDPSACATPTNSNVVTLDVDLENNC